MYGGVWETGWAFGEEINTENRFFSREKVFGIHIFGGRGTMRRLSKQMKGQLAPSESLAKKSGGAQLE